MLFCLFALINNVYSYITCPNCVFNDNGKELISLPPNIVEFSLPKEVEIIYGLDQYHTASIKCQTTLKKLNCEPNNLLKTISISSFEQCLELKEVDLSECKNLETINEYAFYHCQSLTKLIFPFSSKLTTLGSFAFYGCVFPTITIPNTVTTLGDYVFGFNKVLESIKFETPSKISLLNLNIISSCSSIKFLTIPSSVKTLNLFGRSENTPIEFEIEEGNQYYTMIDGIIFSIDMKSVIAFPSKKKGEFTLPEGIVTINSYAFMYSKLSSIILPSSLVSIESFSFYNSFIESIVFPSSLSLLTIGSYAFQSCKNLKTIIIPEGVTSLGEGLFFYCSSLAYVFIPSTINNIEGALFSDYNSVEIVINETCPIFIIENMLMNLDQTILINYIGQESNIIIPTYTTIIQCSAFYYSNIETVIFEENSQLISIEKNAFFNCQNLQTITFPSSLQKIGDNAFYGCRNLETITFPSSLQTIGDDAFSSCSKLKNVIINSPLTNIGDEAFLFCTQLETLIIESTDTYSIGSLTFSYCLKLSSISLSSNLISLGP